MPQTQYKKEELRRNSIVVVRVYHEATHVVFPGFMSEIANIVAGVTVIHLNSYLYS